jgi:hypothetical protein
MKAGKPEVRAVLVARRQRLRRNAPDWAAARRRALAKAVEYNEALLARLRARLDDERRAEPSTDEEPRAEPSTDQEPQTKRPPAQPEAASSDSLGSARNDASAEEEKRAWSVPSTPPGDQRAADVEEWGKAAPTLTAPAVPISEPPASEEERPRPRVKREPTISAWLPPSVAEAYPGRPEPRPLSSTERAPVLPPPPADHASAKRSVPRETAPRIRKRNLVVGAVVAMVLVAAAVAAVLLVHHGRTSATTVTQQSSVSSPAFALPVLRHNRPRRFSIVLERMALVTRASLARSAKTSAAPLSGSRPSGPVGQVTAAPTSIPGR